MVMEETDVSVTSPAKETDPAEGFAVIIDWGKAAVIILLITCRDNYLMGNFDKIPIISAVWAYHSAKWFSIG